MKNMTNALNKLTKLLAVAIISVSLNAFSVVLDPLITISTNHVSATAGTAITPVTISNRGDSVDYYSIYPAIRNGLSFNKETGTISGAPIVAADPVIYTVTAIGRRGQDTATVVIAVGVGTTNLAFGKPAIQSSNYYKTDRYRASQAVNGNTRGVWYTSSITHTQYEQGAWWQVDLGSKKDIKQIIIYNRTDCCAARLSNYQVSISNKADFSTHTYQQDFHVAPNPRKIIQLDASGKQGRYVRIQLLDSDYLSLAEVQVMGVDPLRFPEVDYSSAQNDFGGVNNAPNYANMTAFAAFKDDRSIPIMTWGSITSGGKKAPTSIDLGYTKLYSNKAAFAILKANGSIETWGHSYFGGKDAPAGRGYTKIYSTDRAFAALKANGSIKVWGNPNSGGVNAPDGKGYTKIYSTSSAFAALKSDGSIKAWGNKYTGGKGAPADKGYIKIYSNDFGFAALKADGSIKAWTDSGSGRKRAPAGKDYTGIYSNPYAFAALKADGSIKAWGNPKFGGRKAPTDKGYIKIYSTDKAFAALKDDGSITSWGNLDDLDDLNHKHKNVPTDKGYTKIYSNASVFSAVKPDGSIRTWGNPDFGGAYASDHNLALGKPATQSSIYPHHIIAVAGYAVDGNTDGEFLNSSTTHTNDEQGAWWQVDLGSRKKISKIIIYNRTDCCVDRLSNYQVTISNKANFSTHTYQQDFHVAPNPKKIIQINGSGKRGRYVRIQLLDKNYLSLAEVQVIGHDSYK